MDVERIPPDVKIRGGRSFNVRKMIAIFLVVLVARVNRQPGIFLPYAPIFSRCRWSVETWDTAIKYLILQRNNGSDGLN
jgi:hypothetical protein